MKNLLFSVFLLAFLSLGCGGNQTGTEASSTEAAETPEVQQEVQQLDSLSMEIEGAKNDIDSASENLDELLNDL
ncbi:MAG: hypothetical protein EP344_02790 [Bacteroidetes bacterium]|nr:MAG: hypothetical protein EP344_02790 [Bacteroidota bacterium]